MVQKIRIGHDGKGSGSGWFLDSVEVEDDGVADSAQLFSCFRWLDAKEDDGLTVLLPCTALRTTQGDCALIKTLCRMRR